MRKFSCGYRIIVDYVTSNQSSSLVVILISLTLWTINLVVRVDKSSLTLKSF